MSDLDDLFLLRNDTASSNFNDAVPDVSKDQTFVHLIKTLNDIEEQKYLKWAIDIEGTLIGTIAIWNFNPIDNSAEFGYTLRSPFRGQGFMIESLQCLLDYGHHDLGIKDLYVYTDIANERSNRMVPKLGFVYQRTVDEEGMVKKQIFHYNVYLHRDE